MKNYFNSRSNTKITLGKKNSVTTSLGTKRSKLSITVTPPDNLGFLQKSPLER